MRNLTHEELVKFLTAEDESWAKCKSVVDTTRLDSRVKSKSQEVVSPRQAHFDGFETGINAGVNWAKSECGPATKKMLEWAKEVSTWEPSEIQSALMAGVSVVDAPCALGVLLAFIAEWEPPKQIAVTDDEK